MRLYREFRQYVGGSGWSAVDPSACSAVVKTMGGTPLENLNASKAATGRWYIETTDALYAGGTDYQAVWTATVAGSEFTRTSVFRHVTAGGSGASAPAVPTLVRAANDLTGSSITATVAPAAGNPDDPVDVLVRLSGGDYASAGSVTGAGGGSLQIAGLDNNTWYAVNAQARAAADANARSLPAQEVWVMCHDGGNLLASALEAVVAALRGSANLAALAPDGNWARADSRGHVFVRIIDGWAGGRSPARAPYIEADLGEMTLPPDAAATPAAPSPPAPSACASPHANATTPRPSHATSSAPFSPTPTAPWATPPTCSTCSRPSAPSSGSTPWPAVRSPSP